MAQRSLFLLTGLRWLPVGVALGVTVLLPLDSASLEAWLVDTLHDHDPGADIARPLARARSTIRTPPNLGRDETEVA